jgi:hypothetical protein
VAFKPERTKAPVPPALKLTVPPPTVTGPLTGWLKVTLPPWTLVCPGKFQGALTVATGEPPLRPKPMAPAPVKVAPGLKLTVPELKPRVAPTAT